MGERDLLREIELPNPMGRLIIHARYPRTYGLRRAVACWLLKIARRIGGFHGITFERV
jgi:hypothetical protein